MAAANTTTDHREIRRWVENHGGHPAAVKRTRGKGQTGMIRIDFPGFAGEGSLQAISWDEWFRQFDEQELAFLYQDGKNTNFNKLVRRDPSQVRPSDRRRGPSRTTRGGRAAARALEAERSRPGASRPSGVRSSAAKRATARRASSAVGQPRRPGRGRAAARRGDGPSMQDKTKAELYALARSAGVPNRSTMSKSELVRALARRGAAAS